MPEPPHEGGFAVSASYRESVNSLTLAVEVGAPDRPLLRRMSNSDVHIIVDTKPLKYPPADAWMRVILVVVHGGLPTMTLETHATMRYPLAAP